MKNFFFVILISLNFSVYGQGYICAIGGGSENYNDWSNAPYSWIVQKADSGKIIILSVNDETNWIPDYFLSLGASSAYNKKIDSRELADSQSTYDELISANAVFIKGGDQYNYISKWKDTKTEDAIRYVFNNGGVISGTSAGAMVLGDVVFTAKHGSGNLLAYITNPFNNNIDLDDDFLGLVPDVLIDSHFTERARFARLIPMIYNYSKLNGKNLMGIGIDDRTAIVIDKNGIGEVMGSGAVAIFQKDNRTIYSNYESGNYTIENLKCDQLIAGWKFNFNSRTISFIPQTAKEVDTSRIYKTPKTNLWLTGTDQIQGQLSNGFDVFLNDVNPQSVLIISNQGFTNEVSIVSDFIASRGFNYDLLFVSENSLQTQDAIDKINNASCFAVLSDSLNLISLLADSTKPASQAFENKISNGTPIYFFGTAGKLSGQYFVGNTDTEPYAGYYGEMTNNIGLNIFKEFVYQPRLLENSDYYENRTSAVLWGLMLNRKRLGVYSYGIELLKINKDKNTIESAGNFPLIVVDARATTKVDSSTYVASSGTNTRQIAAMNNLRYSITTYDGLQYQISTGNFDYASSVSRDIKMQEPDYHLLNNYPNPFNPGTIIVFSLPKSEFITLKIYNILGSEIATLINSQLASGLHKIFFDAKNLPSGVYFYRLKSNLFSQTKSMLLIK